MDTRNEWERNGWTNEGIVKSNGHMYEEMRLGSYLPAAALDTYYFVLGHLFGDERHMLD